MSKEKKIVEVLALGGEGSKHVDVAQQCFRRVKTYKVFVHDPAISNEPIILSPDSKEKLYIGIGKKRELEAWLEMPMTESLTTEYERRQMSGSFMLLWSEDGYGEELHFMYGNTSPKMSRYFDMVCIFKEEMLLWELLYAIFQTLQKGDCCLKNANVLLNNFELRKGE